MKTKEEKLALLKETGETYTTYNRAVGYLRNDGEKRLVCFYYKEGTPGCGVGRLIKNVKKRQSIPFGSVATVWDDLPDEVQEWGLEFLTQLQGLHDVCAHWNETGLTLKGKEYVQRIQKRIIVGNV